MTNKNGITCVVFQAVMTYKRVVDTNNDKVIKRENELFYRTCVSRNDTDNYLSQCQAFDTETCTDAEGKWTSDTNNMVSQFSSMLHIIIVWSWY